MPPPTAYAAATSAYDAHKGITFEVGVGAGFNHITSGTTGMPLDTNAALAGANLGVGGWITPQIAVTGRIAVVNVNYMDLDAAKGRLVNAFFGPSLQFWATPNVWLGGGAGFATYRYVGGNCMANSTSDCSVNGVGLDLRAGYSIVLGQSTLNLSLEANPGFFNNPGATGTATGIGILIGYQYL
jgi:hypothetical protein